MHEDVVEYSIGFGANEWYVIALIVVGAAAVLLLPKRFSREQTLFNLTIGVVFGLMFDHTLAVPPFDLYDVGDEPQYSWFDFLSYAMYAPPGYLFIYMYESLRIRGLYIIPYIVAWTAFAMLIEGIGVLVDLFHYKNGYRFAYSIPIYLFLQSIHLLLYAKLFAGGAKRRR